MSDAHYESLQTVFAGHPEIRLVMLFGSAAAGTERPGSDIDIAVQADRPLDTTTKMSLIAELALTTGRAIDLVDLNTVGAPSLAQIVRHGKRLIDSDAAYARLITRHLIDEADFLPYYRRILVERRSAWIGR